MRGVALAAPFAHGETLETDQVRQTGVQSWGRLEAAKSNIAVTHAQVQAAQQKLVNARVSIVGTNCDPVVTSDTLPAAVAYKTVVIASGSATAGPARATRMDGEAA